MSRLPNALAAKKRKKKKKKLRERDSAPGGHRKRAKGTLARVFLSSGIIGFSLFVAPEDPRAAPTEKSLGRSGFGARERSHLHLHLELFLIVVA